MASLTLTAVSTVDVKVGSATARVSTSSGDITLGLDAVGNVDAAAASGDVRLTVPAGSYRVATDAGSGNRDVEVTSDPAATPVLDVRTGSGNITVRHS